MGTPSDCGHSEEKRLGDQVVRGNAIAPATHSGSLYKSLKRELWKGQLLAITYTIKLFSSQDPKLYPWIFTLKPDRATRGCQDEARMG